MRRGREGREKGEEMSYHASICVGVLYNFIEQRVQQDRCDYIFLQQNVYNIKIHKKLHLEHTKFWTAEDTKTSSDMFFSESCSDFYREVKLC